MSKDIFNQSRNWVFTDFKETDLEAVYEEYRDIIRFIAWGEEVCPSTGKNHNQGWIQFVNPKRRGGVQRVIGHKCFCEPMRGSEYDNEKYCSKDGKYHKYGTMKRQGERTDLEYIKKRIDENATMFEIANDHFGDYIRYHSGFAKYQELVRKEQTKKFRNVSVEVIWGATGTGKTRRYYDPEKCFKIQGSALTWWDGYEGERELLIDEYNNDIGITELLGILDGYQLRLPVKGAHTYANWTKVYITSNIDPLQWHMNARPMHREALMRRITNIVEM